MAVKAGATGLLHETDAGGVRLGLRDEQAIRAAAAAIEDAVTRAGHKLDGLIVRPMAPERVELIVGVVNDDSFGSVPAVTAGGIAAELLNGELLSHQFTVSARPSRPGTDIRDACRGDDGLSTIATGIGSFTGGTPCHAKYSTCSPAARAWSSSSFW